MAVTSAGTSVGVSAVDGSSAASSVDIRREVELQLGQEHPLVCLDVECAVVQVGQAQLEGCVPAHDGQLHLLVVQAGQEHPLT